MTAETLMEFRNEHVVVDGRRTTWRSGTRFAYIMNLKEAIPPVATLKHDGSDITVSVWHYGQTHMKCRWCNIVVTKDHECERKPKRRCHNCGSDNHMKAECTVGRICYKCHGGDHIARDCPGNNQAPRHNPGNRSGDAGNGSQSTILPSDVNRTGNDTGDMSDMDVEIHTSPNPTSLASPSSESDNVIMEAILIGDSNCRDLGLKGDDHVIMRVESLVQGGLSILEASEKLEECDELKRNNAQAVVIHVGTSDFPARDIGEVEDNYTQYVELLTTISSQCPKAQLVISSVLPRAGKGKEQINQQIRDFNKKLASLSEDEPNVMFVDNYIHFEHENGINEQLYKKKDKSGVHVNGVGVARLDASLQEALKEALFKSKYESEWSNSTS